MGAVRLPPRLEFEIVRAAAGLPAPVQRLLFGRPAAIDGQELAPDVQTIMRLAELSGRETLFGGLVGEAARAYSREDSAAAQAGPQPPLAEVRDLELPGPGGPLSARLYVPHGAPPAPRPLLVFFPGGGWMIGGVYTHDGGCRFLASRSGIAILCVNYRLAPEHPFPAAVEDARAAYEWAVANAAELGADPGRIAVGGDSAGGNLAASVCLHAREGDGPRPAMQLLIYPVTEVGGAQRSRRLFAEGFKLTRADIESFEHEYLPDPALAADPRVSPLRAPDLSGLPPTYVATAGFDPLRDEGEEYAARLREAGVRVALRRHPALTHLFVNMTAISPSCREAMAETAGALRMGLAR